MKLIMSSLEEEAVNAEFIKKFCVEQEEETYGTYFYVYADEIVLAKYKKKSDATRELRKLANALAISNEPILYWMEYGIE